MHISLAQLSTIFIRFAFYICYTIQSYNSLSERERVSVNIQGTVVTLARLKTVPSYHQELVSHPLPEHIETLS